MTDRPTLALLALAATPEHTRRALLGLPALAVFPWALRLVVTDGRAPARRRVDLAPVPDPWHHDREACRARHPSNWQPPRRINLWPFVLPASVAATWTLIGAVVWAVVG